MSARLAPTREDLILDRAVHAGREAALPYAGELHPTDAAAVLRAGHAVLVDVRSAEERQFVGRVPESVHAPWATGLGLARNPAFLRELELRVDRLATVLFLCRGGQRAPLAAAAAARIGYASAFIVLEGFEGPLDAGGRRGRLGGWRFHGLDWVQD